MACSATNFTHYYTLYAVPILLRYTLLVVPNLVVVIKDDTHEVSSHEEVLCGIERALEKYSISAPKREDMVARIERKLYDLNISKKDALLFKRKDSYVQPHHLVKACAFTK